MRNSTLRVLLLFIVLTVTLSAFSQTITRTEILKQASVTQLEKEKLIYQQLQTLARQKGWEMVMRDKKGNIAILVGVDALGLPQYLTTESNAVAAATIGTNTLWPGGSAGLNLTGSSNNVKNKLAVWDGGRVRGTHAELTGRVVQRDNPAGNSDHSTHVAGTLVASGANPLAKGMSYGQQELVAYDFNNHISEILGEAPNLLVSNHSYGAISGWSFNETQNRWEFWGQFGANEDYKLGYYSNEAQMFDSIAYNAPFYLIVKSSGNKRNENGPAVGAPYWRFDASGTMSNAGNRPAGISSNDSYDIIPTYGVAKNILTLGAVNPIPNGYTRPSEVVQSAFSSWGPTDDGRIKPDVVADGVGLLSSIASSDNAYATFSGTSMSTPNAAGSVLLLQEYYSQLHGGAFMRSATLKGLVIHTADEAGLFPGPDYQNGWGLMNMGKAAAVITANNTTQIMQENLLNNSASFSLPVIASGNGTISATISWTDPKADVEPVGSALNNPNRKLVNDLDIVIKKGATTYRSWVLNPASPNFAATTGDNVLDNVEKIELPDAVPGATYTIEITHKGTLARGQQAYSLIASGVGGTAYCTSNPTSTNGARIDSVSFANIQNKNAAGCTSYSDFTNLIANAQPTQTLPLFIRLNSCDATAVDKIVKVYMDSNNDGDFEDAGENIATSGVINGDGDYTPNVTIPVGLTPGKYARMRIVVVETNLAASVSPCGTFTRGETQDYRVLISTPVNDLGVPGVISPKTSDCASSAQYVTVRVRNFGTDDKKNIPLTAVVRQGTTVIATLTATYTDTVYAQTEETYTFQTPFNSLPGTTYTITATTGHTGDQDESNNESVTTFTTAANSSAPGGTAAICGTSARLTASPATTDFYTWYNSPTATNPIAIGSPATTSTIASTYYVSKNEVPAKLGPANKLVFVDGGYNTFVNNLVRVTTTTPATIETARLYIGNSGKITFFLREIVSFNETTGAYTYFPVSSVTLDVTATAPTPPVLGGQNNNPADLGAIYYLGMNIPTAGNYGIVIQCQNGASIFRNNNITANPYPYTLPGIISITGNSAIDATDPNFYQRFYYFFYDVTVKLTSCPSARVPIVATTSTAPVITLNGNQLSSTAAVSYQWYRNSTPVSGANSQTFTPTQSGQYTVEATDASGCTLQSNAVDFVLTPVTNVDPGEIKLIVSPNPTVTGEFNIQLETNTRANLYISLMNTVGQRVYHQSINNFVGRLSQPVKPGKLAAGVYYLQVQHDKKMYIQKIVIGR